MLSFSSFLTEIYRDFLAEIYRDGPGESTFSYNGKTYDISGLLSATLGMEEHQIPVSELTWIFDQHNQLSSKEDRQRIAAADLSAPLLLIRSNNKWIVADGLHRLKKAVMMKKLTLPVIFVSDALLQKYLIPSD